MKVVKIALFIITILFALFGLRYFRLSQKLATNMKFTNSKCGTVKSSVEWKYCFTPGSGDGLKKVIYYFHGGGGNEKSWLDPNNYPEEIRQNWEKNKIDAPNVVAISFGEMWILARRSSREKSGLYDVMKDEVLPYVEKYLVTAPLNQRILIGESMGGFNAGAFALSNTNLFSKVALLCPGIAVANEKNGNDLKSYIEETGAESNHAEFVLKVREEYFPSWEAAHAESPLTLLQQLHFSGNLPKLYLSCGDKDEFGFFHGAVEFSELAKQKGFEVTWVPVFGQGHCSADIKGLIHFLR